MYGLTLLRSNLLWNEAPVMQNTQKKDPLPLFSAKNGGCTFNRVLPNEQFMLEAWKILEAYTSGHSSFASNIVLTLSLFFCNIILELGFNGWNTQRSIIITGFVAAFLILWWAIPPKNLYIQFELTSTYFPDYSTAILVSSTRYGALPPAARDVSHSKLHLP